MTPRPSGRLAPLSLSLGLSLGLSLAASLCLGGCPSGGTGASATTAGATSGSTATPTSPSAAPSAAAPATGASTSGPSASSKPPPKPYSGPTGTLSGTVRIKGDKAPDVAWIYAEECRGAAATYGKLFRTGIDGSTLGAPVLADAVVAVTDYQGFVPPKDKEIHVTIRDCAYSTRSIAITDGQHIVIKNLDAITSYVPHLDGARLPTVNVAVPRGPAVNLYTRGPGRYWLRDQMGRKFMVADVFHFRYSTTSVTGLDGKYRIEGIPVGKVSVSAMLPEANLLSVTKKDVDIKQGDNTLDLVLEFDAQRDDPKAKKAKKAGKPEKK